MLVGIKRIYEKASILDGTRILVDGLWPRGVKKSTSNVDEWYKGIAPSKELRQWFSHDPARWEAFKKKYTRELEGNKELGKIVEVVKATDVTLIYSTQDEKHNNAVVLAAVIKEKAKAKKVKALSS